MKYFFAFLCIFSNINFVKAQQAVTANVVSFKANGEDTLDDTKAIQDCIDYVSSKGGGTVFFPKGTYLISKQKIPGQAICLLAKNNVLLAGEDKNKCILKLANNQPGFSSVLNIAKAKNFAIKKPYV